MTTKPTKATSKTTALTICTLLGLAVAGFIVESVIIIHMFVYVQDISYTYFISYVIQVVLTEMVIMIAAGVDLNLSISKTGATLKGDMDEPISDSTGDKKTSE